MSDLITAIALEGHDSELFAFLDAAYRQELLTHPAGKKPLWTFAETGECDELRKVAFLEPKPRSPEQVRLFDE